jgi:hypothetical protein
VLHSRQRTPSRVLQSHTIARFVSLERTITPPPANDQQTGLRNPQVLIAVITATATVLAALIGLAPPLLNFLQSQATPTVMPTAIPPTRAEPTAIVAPTLTEPTAIVAPTAMPPTLPNIILPSATPVTGRAVQLLYDEVSLNVVNTDNAAPLSLADVVFRSTTGEWQARSWGTVYTALPAGMCLRLRDASVGQRPPPAPCRDRVFALAEVAGNALFWRGASTFEVWQGATLINTCTVAEGACLLILPQP